MTDKVQIVLPKAPTQQTLTLLVRARAMLLHATQHAAGVDELDGMLAVLGLDATVEYLLRTISSHLDLEAVTGQSFDIIDLASLAGSIHRALAEHSNVRLHHLADLKLLRQARNLVQHGAVSPRADLPRFQTTVERFMRRVLKEIFGIEADEVASSALVKNSEVRVHLRRAEDALHEKEYLVCIVACRDAFENAYYERVRGSPVGIPMYPLFAKSNDREFVHWAMKTIMDELEASRLGVNTPQFRRFEEYRRHIPLQYCAESSVSTLMQRPWERADASFCYSFVADTILRWEAVGNHRLYDVELPQRAWRCRIGAVDLGAESAACTYFYGTDDVVELWFVGDKTKAGLMALGSGPLEYESSVDGVVHMKTIRILGRDFKLVTNNPPRWSFVVWYEADSTARDVS